MYRYLRWQDIQLRFDEIQNMDIYITSYFRPDKESNTIYPKSVKTGVFEEITFEMYNKTTIYAIP
jgi:hypothetical protein